MVLGVRYTLLVRAQDMQVGYPFPNLLYSWGSYFIGLTLGHFQEETLAILAIHCKNLDFGGTGHAASGERGRVVCMVAYCTTSIPLFVSDVVVFKLCLLGMTRNKSRNMAGLADN